MATAKKPAKKAAKPAAKAKAPAATKKPSEPQYAMPMEVKEWIERANSIMKRLQSEVDRLKEENSQLKAYKRFAESRILKADYE